MRSKMSHHCKFVPTVATGVLFDQFCNIMSFRLVKYKSVRGTGFEIALVALKNGLCLFFSAFYVIVKFGFHISFEVTEVASVFVFL